MTPAASIVVPTRNRKAALRDALQSALAQRASVEVIVVDDGSTDGTSEMVRMDFPTVRLERLETTRQVAAARNRGCELALAPVVIAIDDDVRMTSSDTVAQALRDLAHPRVGAVSIPWMDFPTGNRLSWDPDTRRELVERGGAPSRDGVWVRHAYRGSAYAVRRDLFLALGGYRSELGQDFEEPELCLRMLDAGYVVRAGRSDRVDHFAAVRDEALRIIHGGRNPILLAAWNVPAGSLPGRLLKIHYKLLMRARCARLRGPVVRGLGLGYRDAIRTRRSRRPVRRSTWHLWTALLRAAALPFEEIAGRLAPPRWGDLPNFEVDISRGAD